MSRLKNNMDDPVPTKRLIGLVTDEYPFTLPGHDPTCIEGHREAAGSVEKTSGPTTGATGF